MNEERDRAVDEQVTKQDQDRAEEQGGEGISDEPSVAGTAVHEDPLDEALQHPKQQGIRRRPAPRTPTLSSGLMREAPAKLALPSVGCQVCCGNARRGVAARDSLTTLPFCPSRPAGEAEQRSGTRKVASANPDGI